MRSPLREISHSFTENAGAEWNCLIIFHLKLLFIRQFNYNVHMDKQVPAGLFWQSAIRFGNEVVRNNDGFVYLLHAFININITSFNELVGMKTDQFYQHLNFYMCGRFKLTHY